MENLDMKIEKVNAHLEKSLYAFSSTKSGCAFSLTFRKGKEYVDRLTQDKMSPSPGGGVRLVLQITRSLLCPT